jgi:hypothetical protein
MDRFPEAFERFESDVDVDRFQSYFELALAFQSWAGRNWKGTAKQWEALDRESENFGFYPTNSYRGARREGLYMDFYERPRQTWKQEVVTVKGKAQNRYRDLKTGRFIKKP